MCRVFGTSIERGYPVSEVNLNAFSHAAMWAFLQCERDLLGRCRGIAPSTMTGAKAASV
jgi:hypothetical protein